VVRGARVAARRRDRGRRGEERGERREAGELPRA
jgi:hypothetical protein